jgi:uracil-DNA glycosylase
MHVVAPPFAHSSGPRTAKLAFVAECWGEQEDMAGRPLVGNAGQEFTRLLCEAGIDRRECFLTNTIAARPPDNKFEAHFCCKKGELPPNYALPPLSQGNYLKPEYCGELDRLCEELCTVRPNLVVALGAKALWALSGSSATGAMRGTVATSRFVLHQGNGSHSLATQKILATYHPSYLFKVWSHRPIVLADLMKAKREAAFPEVRRPERTVLVRPTIGEIEEFYEFNLRDAACIAVDIETKAGQISDIGFAPSRRKAMVVTFLDPKKADASYWESPVLEVAAWKWVQRILALPCKKLFQNGVFDISYLMKQGLRVVNCADDTMLLHHSYYPELQKSLAFLGSIYTSEPAWKLMVRHKKEELLKKDE